MELGVILEVIASLGFPIAAVVAMAWFVFTIYKASEKREDALREELKENREINGRFAEIITKYSVELTEIKENVKDIKEDMIVLTEHIQH